MNAKRMCGREHSDLIKKDGESDTVDCQSRLELLMVSSPDREDLVFPKGKDDETIGKVACHAALEEAGVKGILDESPLGMWKFRSKSTQNSRSTEGSYREEDNHGRRWGPHICAAKFVSQWTCFQKPKRQAPKALKYFRTEEIFPVGIHYSDMGSSSSWSPLRNENCAPSCDHPLKDNYLQHSDFSL
ncbi:hypothetical protein C5167_048317 [Papaver somniferum]|uniref:Nudix hydrolase domain-containing protein n=1 Tax=Papaver somniferum TaxID=3469 RepID=A0A4Y7KHL9_PAPSO|nr:hypothetical protein C5167_048317 [Papaver somniferum]